jgi:hypothetical protein
VAVGDTVAAIIASPTPPTAEPIVTLEGLRAGRALLAPLVFTLALGAFGLLPSSAEVPALRASFFGAAALLLAWNAFVYGRARRAGRTFELEVVLRKQHYLQACAHLSIYAYWGWHWRQVYASAHLIVAQLVFAYAFDMLLAWSRRGRYTLGFGPFPIIFSTNLFLWFKPDWFYLQLLMVGLGFAAKELLRWRRDGRSTHIFNPSSLPLSLFSVGLLLAHATDVTWGREIATTLFYPPHIYLWIFLIGLPGQYFFGVTTMTMSAAVTVWGWSALYYRVTGTYYFFDSYIPIAVFLGMHLLFTDPSTSPRGELGRILFGVGYGAAVVACYALLGGAHLDTFYDKLLPVPILNLGVRAIERLAGSPRLRRLDPTRVWPDLPPRRRNLAYMTVWIAIFGALSATRSLADTHPGNRLPFWQKACTEDRRNGCHNLATMEARYCYSGIGWACNELGILTAEGRVAIEPTSSQLFRRACERGVRAGCENADRATAGETSPGWRRQSPRADEYPLMLETKGYPPAETPAQTLQNACDQAWPEACLRLGSVFLHGESVPPDPARAAALLRRACALGAAEACRAPPGP